MACLTKVSKFLFQVWLTPGRMSPSLLTPSGHRAGNCCQPLESSLGLEQLPPLCRVKGQSLRKVLRSNCHRKAFCGKGSCHCVGQRQWAARLEIPSHPQDFQLGPLQSTPPHHSHEVRGSHLGGTVAPGRSQTQGTRIPSAGAAIWGPHSTITSP